MTIRQGIGKRCISKCLRHASCSKCQSGCLTFQLESLCGCAVDVCNLNRRYTAITAISCCTDFDFVGCAIGKSGKSNTCPLGTIRARLCLNRSCVTICIGVQIYIICGNVTFLCATTFCISPILYRHAISRLGQTNRPIYRTQWSAARRNGNIICCRTCLRYH